MGPRDASASKKAIDLKPLTALPWTKSSNNVGWDLLGGNIEPICRQHLCLLEPPAAVLKIFHCCSYLYCLDPYIRHGTAKVLVLGKLYSVPANNWLVYLWVARPVHARAIVLIGANWQKIRGVSPCLGWRESWERNPIKNLYQVHKCSAPSIVQRILNIFFLVGW